MKKLLALFTEHPASVGENYFGHMAMAAGFGLRMVFCGLACFIHALLPFLFVTVATDTVTTLHKTLIINRRRTSAGAGNLDDVGEAVTGSSQSSR